MSSPFLRAKQTAEIVLHAVIGEDVEAQVVVENDLRPVLLLLM